MPRKKKADPAAPNVGKAVASIKYPAKRKNIPRAGLEAQGVPQKAPRIRYEYNPHLPPNLRSATDATEVDKLPELLAIARKRPLTDDEARTLAGALRWHEPWLEWSGKPEKPWFEVEPVALHMHERKRETWRVAVKVIDPWWNEGTKSFVGELNNFKANQITTCQ